MRVLNKYPVYICCIALIAACTSVSKIGKHTSSAKSSPSNSLAAADSPKNSSIIQPYKKIITAQAQTSKGLFTIHKVGQHFYFEIPDSLLDRDIMTVNRIEKAASEARIGVWGMAGDPIGQNIVRFTRGIDHKLFIKRISFHDRSQDSSANGMYYNVMNSNLQPIVASFDIKAFTEDSTASLIDVTDYLNGENDVFFFNVGFKKAYLATLGAYQPNKSYIQKIKAFPQNIEIKTVKTFINDGQSELSFTFELNSSVILLPRQPMKSRISDPRVGYFTDDYSDFDDPKGIKVSSNITRWRLEPKKEDIPAYLAGSLVTPKKPIVFYIDPTTPKKWIPYLIAGVNDWQKAFEKAGFKNAITAYEAPSNDNTWSIDDATHSVIVFKPSQIQNASGPHVSDPRSGEILESHINIYYNIIKLLHDWYFVQVGPNDPNAGTMLYNDSLMGSLLRYVCCHEVGHTLGLLHNFGASATVPTEKLRDKNWVEKNGFCPSIMDYARFNYVAQPQDSIAPSGLLPRIGAYDEWAIDWGYRWFPESRNDLQLTAYLNHWITDVTSSSPNLWYGFPLYSFDPRCQSEDLGDNPMIANKYGIENLKRVMTNLHGWTRDSSSEFASFSQMKEQVVTQYQRYLTQVCRYVGGVEFTRKTTEQKGPLWEFVDKDRQKEAIRFLNRQLFNTPTWLVDPEIFGKAGGSSFYGLIEIQKKTLASILSTEKLNGLLYYQANSSGHAYSPDALLTDLETEIWKELRTSADIDFYRRNLQKIYASQLAQLLDEDINERSFNTYTDCSSILKAHIRGLIHLITEKLPSYKNGLVKYHLADIKDALQKALQPDNTASRPKQSDKEAISGSLLPQFTLPARQFDHYIMNCWPDKNSDGRY